jgi:hypothetical protein
MDQRIVERVAREAGPLQSLTSEELELDKEPMTRDPQPKPVRAWVRFGKTPVVVDAEICSWTPRAGAIRFTLVDQEYKTWVWLSAIREASRPASSGTTRGDRGGIGA